MGRSIPFRRPFMKLHFRPHRGSLDAAMAEAVTVDGVGGLLAHLQANEYPPEDVRIEPYGGDDHRICWKDVHIVVVDGYGVAGFVAAADDAVALRSALGT
jgi:hypothetical protein